MEQLTRTARRLPFAVNSRHVLLAGFLLVLGLSLSSVIKLELVVNGVFVSAIIAVGAMGLTLVYGILKFAHIAHGDFMTLGSYISLWLVVTAFSRIGIEGSGLGSFTFGYPLLLALPISVATIVALGIGLDLGVYRRLRQRRVGFVVMAMASLGIAIALRGLVQIVWGGGTHQYPRLSKPFYQLPMSVRIPPDSIFVAALTVTIVVALYLFLTRTKMGKAMRATSDNMELARVSGINTQHVIWWTWAIGAGLAATAGVLLAIFQAQLFPIAGWRFLIPLFTAVILGGIGNPYGALMGALVIGISSEVSTQWFNPSYKPAVAFIIMIVVLLIRPTGIFGTRD